AGDEKPAHTVLIGYPGEPGLLQKMPYRPEFIVCEFDQRLGPRIEGPNIFRAFAEYVVARWLEAPLNPALLRAERARTALRGSVHDDSPTTVSYVRIQALTASDCDTF